MLDVRRMRVLREVAACGSFSAAAESLSFTQSAISQHVAALERETGTQLVERGRRGVRLTDAGRVLGTPTAALVGKYGRLRAAVAAPDGSVWVSTSNYDGKLTPNPGDDKILRIVVSGAGGVSKL